MTDPQGPGGGALDPHHHLHHHHAYSFIPPPPTSKPYVHQNGISDLTQSHIALLKNSPLPPSWLPPTTEQDHPRLSDTFSEMRYLELNNWDLNTYGEGLTARLVDTRSIDSADTPINYRPWEKPDSSTNGQHPPPPSTPTTTSSSTPSTQSNGQIKQENGVSSTNSPENKSPPTLTPLTNAFPTFTDAFQPPQKLPSFQSQFNAFTDSQPPPPHHHQLLDPQQPSLPSFHTLPANTRYPPPPHTAPPHSSQLQHAMVPTPVLSHHRDPQPFLEDRHIQLFPGQVPLPHTPHQFPATIIATTQNGSAHHPQTYHVQMNGTPATYTPVIPSTSLTSTTSGVVTGGTTTLQLQELVPVPPMHTLLHPTAINVPRTLNSTDGSIPGLNLNIIDTHAHFPPQPQHHGGPPHPPQNGNLNLIPKYIHDPQSSQPQLIAVKLQPFEPLPQKERPNHTTPQNGHMNGTSPPTQPPHQQQQPDHHHRTNGTQSTPSTPKRQGKRKRHDQQNGTLQNGNTHHHDPNNAHQVSSVSSTEPGFKRPNLNVNGISKHVNGNGHTNGHDDGMDKPVKKKRKRCGECIGCQRKDNCGECAPCRNDKSHQICKQRRCDKLTEKKTPKSKLKQQQQQQQQQIQPHHH